MYFLALAVDFDGTVAEHGVIDEATVQALQSLKDRGRALILVTGRIWPDLEKVLPDPTLFDRIVAENGGVIYDPQTRQSRPLAPLPSPRLVDRLRAEEIHPLWVGDTIVATWEPHHTKVFDAIHDLKLELEMIFNKGAVMVLSTGVNKGTGVSAALEELGLSANATIAVGDAENDYSLLDACGLSAAVANATPELKARADIVLTEQSGAGVASLIERVLASDGMLLARTKRGTVVAKTRKGTPHTVFPSDGNILIIGDSRCGKSTFGAGLIEQFVDQGAEVCIFDPEGDYTLRPNLVPVGGSEEVPDLQAIGKLIYETDISLCIGLAALDHDRRAGYLADIWSTIDAIRRRTGRPDWLIIDEAHQLFPRDAEYPGPSGLPAAVILTLHPDMLAKKVLDTCNTICALGNSAAKLIAAYCARMGVQMPMLPDKEEGEMLIWRPHTSGPVLAARPGSPKIIHRRHAGKYAEGDVGDERSFYFRGPHKSLNLKARNLFEFIAISRDLDESVWRFHLLAGDIERWFRHVIRDTSLADETRTIAGDPGDGQASREKIRAAIIARYRGPMRTGNGSS